jgi:hypothetical protein
MRALVAPRGTEGRLEESCEPETGLQPEMIAKACYSCTGLVRLGRRMGLSESRLSSASKSVVVVACVTERSPATFVWVRIEKESPGTVVVSWSGVFTVSSPNLNLYDK